MPLESLLQLVETLRERISSHRAVLSQSESRTRYALIDPLLRELGWDTSDPEMVKIEYESSGARVDYALFAGGRLRIIVEAKKLRTTLDSSVLSQAIAYSERMGGSHFSITDGAHWKIYNARSQSLIAEFRIARPNIDRPDFNAYSVEAIFNPAVHSAETVTNCRKAVPLWRPGVWHRLTDIKYATGLKPDGLLFPDDCKATLKSWRDLPVEVVRWLRAKSILTPSDFQIRAESTKSKSYLVNTRPYHRSRRKFRSPSKEINGLYFELDYGADSLASNTMTIIRHVGQDPGQFKVRFS